MVNATFIFGGVEFPIHPLDLNFDGFNLEADGKSYCVGAVSELLVPLKSWLIPHQFQPYSFDIKQDGNIIFDMILGMAFCECELNHRSDRLFISTQCAMLTW